MRKLGIVGGIAPASTLEYYRLLIDGSRALQGEREYPHIILNSINLRDMLPLFEAGDKKGAVALLTREVTRLASAGADVALFASNTPHLYFHDLEEASPLPLISITRAVAQEASRLGIQRALLLGTGFTMNASFYQDACQDVGIKVVVPGAPQREAIHALYMRELVPGRFTDETRDALLLLASDTLRSSGAECVLLGGTELGLLFREGDFGSLTTLDSTRIHVNAALQAINE